METQNQNENSSAPESKLSVPAAIIVAGVIVALALIYTGVGKGSGSNPDLAGQKNSEQKKQADNVVPVSPGEHILGNPNAQVMVVEFSDIECPFCKRFHDTMHQVIEEYGKDGKVAWVYRHFPLQIHPKATPEAEATECVWEQGGNELFWSYLDALFAASLSNNQTDPAVPAQVAKTIGVDMAKYNECTRTRKYQAKVVAQMEDGFNSGVTGTPYSIVIAANGKKFPINGALPIESVRTVIEQALKEK